ncbi:MAG: hypothetical protein K0R70_1159, partial [Steroidobacteraceae bacterium]|nr:hypothetical protein [Steroidobacteraceae bacterium]
MSEFGSTALLLLALSTAFGLIVGVLLGRRGRHEAEVRL